MPIDVTEATFEQDVIARSSQTGRCSSTSGPTGVGPCHALAPVIEAAVEAAWRCRRAREGRRGCQPGVSPQSYSVSGIPAVKAFRDGRVVAEFTGVRSRVALDMFLDDLLAPPRADTLVDELRATGELPDVVAALDADDVEGALRFDRRGGAGRAAGRVATGYARSRLRCSSGSGQTIRS